MPRPTPLLRFLGVPQATLANPFPGGLVPVAGKAFGTYTNLGGAATWYKQDFTNGVNDRINVSLERALPGKIVADLTYFVNLGRDLPYNWDVNQIDPRIGFQVQNAVNATVANPFYNALPAAKMPGQLRTQQNIAVSQFLRPYPQYTSLTQALINGRGDHYQAFQLSVQRAFSNGFNLVLGYNYNHETSQEFYDNVDTFHADIFVDSGAECAASPDRREHIRTALWQAGAVSCNPRNPLVDAVFGGWSVSGLFTYNSGVPLRLGSVLADGDPAISNPTSGRWFDTSKVHVLPAFTRRTNPVQYSDLLGPRFVNLDTTLAKMFPIKERVKFELRMEAYNLLNAFSGDNPVLARLRPLSARSSPRSRAYSDARYNTRGGSSSRGMCFR